MTIYKIPLTKPKDRWVNENNFLKLTGFGKTVASIVNFSIRHFQETDYPNVSKDWFLKENLWSKVSIDIHHFPAQEPGILDEFEKGAEQIQKSMKQSTFMTTNGHLTHKDSQNRLCLISVYPPIGNGGGVISIYSSGDTRIEPMSTVTTVPIDYVVHQQENFSHQYVVYVHSLCSEHHETHPIFYTKDDSSLHYIGITKQGWRKRFAQHLSNARSGSMLLFHRALRDHYVGCRMIAHRVLAICQTEKEAMDLEEKFVKGHERSDFDSVEQADSLFNNEKWVSGTLYPKGLNMIPGGYAGLRVLHKMGAMKENKPLDIEARDNLLIKCLDRSNPLLAAYWNDEDYATKIICGPEGRLKPNQIREARILGFLGRETLEIKNIVGAKNENQIQNLLKGRTYYRIK